MELEELMQESIEHQEKSFYSNKFYYSYSSLSKLLWNPQVFYQLYVLGLKEEKVEAHLVQGKLIHLLLLEPERFDQEFIVSPASLPTGNLRLVIDRVYRHHVELARNGDPREKLEEFDQAILDIMRDMKYHQSLKTDQQRLDKVLMAEGFSYWGFLKSKGNKTLIDQDIHKFCTDAVEIIKTNRSVCDLLGCSVTEFDNVEIVNEQMFQMDIPGKIFGIKGIIDNIVINHDKKTIYVNDLKTTSKDLKDFSESVEYFTYWLQCVIYMIMIGRQYDSLITDQGYQVKFHFVVVDRAFQAYAFPVTESTMNKWLDRFKVALETAEWHYVNRSYDLPYEFAKGSVVL